MNEVHLTRLKKFPPPLTYAIFTHVPVAIDFFFPRSWIKLTLFESSFPTPNKI